MKHKTKVKMEDQNLSLNKMITNNKKNYVNAMIQRYNNRNNQKLKTKKSLKQKLKKISIKRSMDNLFVILYSKVRIT